MTNPSLFNGDVSMTSAVGLPQVTKSVLVCNPRVTLAFYVRFGCVTLAL